MTTKRAAMIFCWLLYCALTASSAELSTVSDLNQLGRIIPSSLREKRVGLLKKTRLPATRNSNPTFPEMLELVNEELAAQKAAFRLSVHVGKGSEAWWKEARKMTLSESYEMRSADAPSRRKYLTTASGWDIVKLVSLGWGTPDPLFFKSALTLSSEVGSLPETLKEHLPVRKERAK